MRKGSSLAHQSGPHTQRAHTAHGIRLGNPTTLFQDRERTVRSVIEADGEVLGQLATELRNRIYDDFADSVFDPTENEYTKIEAHALKRGSKDVSFCEIRVEAWLSAPSMQPHTGCGNQGRGDEQKNQRIP